MYNAIMDCDPGHGDVIALRLASRADSIRIPGVTVATENRAIENVTHNARRVLDCAGVTDVGVCASASWT